MSNPVESGMRHPRRDVRASRGHRLTWYLVDETQKQALTEAWQAVRDKASADGAQYNGRFHIRGQHDFQEVEIWKFASTTDAFEHWQALCAALKNGELQALIAQNPKQQGTVAMDIADALIAGKTVEPVTMAEIVAFTSDQPELADRYEYVADCM